MKFKFLVLTECFTIGSIPLIWFLPKPINYVAYTLSLGLGILIAICASKKEEA